MSWAASLIRVTVAVLVVPFVLFVQAAMISLAYLIPLRMETIWINICELQISKSQLKLKCVFFYGNHYIVWDCYRFFPVFNLLVGRFHSLNPSLGHFLLDSWNIGDELPGQRCTSSKKLNLGTGGASGIWERGVMQKNA